MASITVVAAAMRERWLCVSDVVVGMAVEGMDWADICEGSVWLAPEEDGWMNGWVDGYADPGLENWGFE